MQDLANKRVVVLGAGKSGLAAAELLRRAHATVTVLDEANTELQQAAAAHLRSCGIEVELAAKTLPEGRVDLAVLSPGVGPSSPLRQQLLMRDITQIGELELGYQNSRCLHIAVTGTNGKTTTTRLVERMLTDHGLKTAVAGNTGLPISSVVDQTRELDFLTLEVSSCQLETIQFFRPIIAVLLNVSSDHLDRYPRRADYVKAKAALFMNQQPFDWAIIQSEALAQLRAMNVKIPSKVVTFSVNNRRADIYFDRGLLMSRMEGWEGRLLDLDTCLIRGPHNAENLMAALAVGRVLRIPLETMVESLKACTPPAHRCAVVRTRDGVSYINDSKSTNLDALHKALLSVPGRAGEPNVWLLAGGRDKGAEYHDVGPLLSQRVKGAFLVGEAREKIRAAWSLFTPCTLVDSLLEAVSKAAERAIAGDVVLLSPACSSFDQFQNYQHRGDVFCQAVNNLTPAVTSGPDATSTSILTPSGNEPLVAGNVRRMPPANN